MRAWLLMLCAAAPVPLLPAADALRTTFPDEDAQRAAAAACPGPEDAAVQRCLLARLFSADAAARAEATQLWERHGHLVGVVPEHEMDGGFRGRIHIVPALPEGPARVHLGYVASALDGMDAFMDALQAHATAPVRYQWAPLPVRFFRSVGRGTPSAYVDWEGVAYNLNGSLNTSAAKVAETLFHELFHYNDGKHGGWSERVLTPVFDRIVARCGARTRCLTPYAPHSTRVKGGTYYAFQPGNGVGEYAAELAIRYRREQVAVLDGGPPVRPAFKCGPAENAAAWRLMVEEFFGGVDLTPACP